jgi:hypothetical protein
MRRRYQIRRYGRRLTSGEAAGAVVAGAVLAVAVHFTGHGAAAPAVNAAAITGGSYTPASWAGALLSAGGWPQTGCNLGAVGAWEAAEGGNWENSAAFNPLDTTQYEPGSSVMNSDGVRAYTSWEQGFQATLTTLGYPAYAGIRSALAAGDDAQAVAVAVAASPWGTGPFTASC